MAKGKNHKKNAKKRAKKHSYLVHFKRNNALSPYYVKFECYTRYNNNTAVTANIYFGFPLNYPMSRLDGGATWAKNDVMATDYTNMIALFKEYRTHALEVTFEPCVVDTLIPTSAQDFPNLVYIVPDPTDISGTVSEANFMQEGVKPIPFASGSKPITRRMVNRSKVWNQTPNFDLAPAAAPLSNLATQKQNAYGGIRVFAPNVQLMTTIGRIYSRWYVEFRGNK